MAINDDVRVKLGSRYDGRGTKQAISSLRRMTGMLIGSGGLMMAMRSVIATGANFEQSIKTTGVLANANEKEFAALEQTARRLGATTKFTATQASDAMQEYARAGFSAKETTDAIGGALALAAATNAEMTQATTAMSNTIRQFGLDAKASAKIADVFTFAVNNSKFDIEGLTQAMRFAGTVGASFGQSVESTVSALAMFADLGIKAGFAGRQYKEVMSRLGKGADEVRDSLAKYGITLEDVNPATHSFAQIVQTLADNSITAADAIQMFGARAGGNMAMIATKVREGTLSIDGFTKKLVDSTGTAAKTSKQLIDTVDGDWKILMSTMQERAIQAFEAMKPAIRTILNGVTLLIRGDALADMLLGKAETGQEIMERTIDTSVGLIIKMDDKIKLTNREWERQFEILQKLQAQKALGLRVDESSLVVASATLDTLTDKLGRLQRDRDREEKRLRRLQSGDITGTGSGGELRGVAPPTKGPDVEDPKAKAARQARLDDLKLMGQEAARLAEKMKLMRANLQEFLTSFSEKEAARLAEQVTGIQTQYNEILANTELSEELRFQLIAEKDQKIRLLLEESTAKRINDAKRIADAAIKEADRAAKEQERIDKKASDKKRAAQAEIATMTGDAAAGLIEAAKASDEERGAAFQAWAAQQAGIAAALSVMKLVPFPLNLALAPPAGAAAAALISAIKFHKGGIAGDEVPAILQRREGVLTNTRGMAAAGGPVGLRNMNQFGISPGGQGGGVTIQAFDQRSFSRFTREQLNREVSIMRELNIRGMLDAS